MNNVMFALGQSGVSEKYGPQSMVITGNMKQLSTLGVLVGLF